MNKYMKIMGKVNWETWVALCSAVLLVAIWQVSINLGWLHSVFFPAPSAILRSAVDMLRKGELQSDVTFTLVRMLAGFSIGTIAGMLVGLAMGWSKTLRLLLDPLVTVVYPIPKIAILPLIMLIIGIGEQTTILVIALSAFFPVLINCVAGVVNISPTYFDVAKNYGANRFQIFTKVILPGSLPLTFAGIRTAFGMALTMVVVIEMTMASKGLGAMLWLAWITLRVDRIYVAIILIAIISLLINPLINIVAALLAPWKPE
jgi:ABC-type nitrate/sulfonate/bicarbonate transport system permease component